MKDLAGFYARSRRVKGGEDSDTTTTPRRPRKPRARRTFLTPDQVERPPETETGTESVYQVPDAWEASSVKLRDRADAEMRGPETSSEPHPMLLPGAETKRRGRPPAAVDRKRKSRRVSMSLSVSEEEELILRAFVAKHGLTFSEWARAQLFTAMQRQVPARPQEP